MKVKNALRYFSKQDRPMILAAALGEMLMEANDSLRGGSEEDREETWKRLEARRVEIMRELYAMGDERVIEAELSIFLEKWK